MSANCARRNGASALPASSDPGRGRRRPPCWRWYPASERTALSAASRAAPMIESRVPAIDFSISLRRGLMSSNSGSGVPGLDRCADRPATCASRLRISAGSMPATCAADDSSRLEMSSSRLSRPRIAASPAGSGTRVSMRCGERGEAGVDGVHDAGAVGLRLALVEPVGDLVQAALEIAKQHVALFDGVALAAFHHARQHVEALLEALEDIVGVGHGRRAVDLVGDHRDLLGQALHRLFRQIGAAGEFVDPARQHAEAVDDLAAGTVLRRLPRSAGRARRSASRCARRARGRRNWPARRRSRRRWRAKSRPAARRSGRSVSLPRLSCWLTK